MTQARPLEPRLQQSMRRLSDRVNGVPRFHAIELRVHAPHLFHHPTNDGARGERAQSKNDDGRHRGALLLARGSRRGSEASHSITIYGLPSCAALSGDYAPKMSPPRRDPTAWLGI